jgi:D-3-phosphoglycerate dehydrogenase
MLRARAGSRHIIDEAALAAMRPGAILVNCARGPLVDEPALVNALQSGHIAGAGMDVFEHVRPRTQALRARMPRAPTSHARSVCAQEPLPASSPLRGMAQVLLAPHNANASPVSHERVHWNTLKNLLATLGVPFEPEADATPHKMAPAAAPGASFVV